ncbi:MAG: AAA family ATPase [Planctomycetota bacterium]
MQLKRLELFGFKSFADRTVMDFTGNRMTGIVGPNGCGKSNVVDAVRWVLGETRPTSMRGAGMTDVIFKGSASRPALGVAEVTLVLDNDCGTILERGSEVAITRRLFKEGEGEYLIDGVPVRLKDVKDMLFDTGLGSRGYSVLEQGRIDAVLSANPQQRRAIFEEAAGTSRYRQRKHEAELRLKRVDQDMERLEDVMGELRTRQRSLKIQAGKAERYVEARREWTDSRTKQLRHKLHGIGLKLAELGPELDRLRDEQDRLREQRSELEAARHETEDARTRVVGELDQASSEAGRLEGDLRALAERREQLNLRVSGWLASAQEEAGRAETLREQLAAHRRELGQMVESTAGLESKSRQAEADVQRLAREHKELATAYKDARTAVQQANEAVLAALQQRTKTQNRAQHLEEAQEPAAERLRVCGQRLEQAQEEAVAAQQRLADARAGLEQHSARFQAAQAQVASLAVTLAEAEAERESLAKAANECEVEMASLEARRQSLLDLERQREELSGGTQKLMDALSAGEGPCTGEALRGVVADHLSIDTRLARALDVVLAERAATIVAQDAHVARAIVDWASREKLGQIPVVVPPGLGAPVCPSPSDYALFARYGNGVEGRLSDLVQCAPEMRALARALCCDVVVVSDLDMALALVAQNPAWRFVTPKGELVDAAGVLGGYREVTQGAVGRRSEAGRWSAALRLLPAASKSSAINSPRKPPRSPPTAPNSRACTRNATPPEASTPKPKAPPRPKPRASPTSTSRCNAWPKTAAAWRRKRKTSPRNSPAPSAWSNPPPPNSSKRTRASPNSTRPASTSKPAAKPWAASSTRSKWSRPRPPASFPPCASASSPNRSASRSTAPKSTAEGRSQNFIANAEQGKVQAATLVTESEILAERRSAMEETSPACAPKNANTPPARKRCAKSPKPCKRTSTPSRSPGTRANSNSSASTSPARTC